MIFVVIAGCVVKKSGYVLVTTWLEKYISLLELMPFALVLYEPQAGPQRRERENRV